MKQSAKTSIVPLGVQRLKDAIESYASTTFLDLAFMEKGIKVPKDATKLEKVERLEEV